MLSLLLILAMLLPEEALLLQRHIEQHTRPALTEGLFEQQQDVFGSKSKHKALVCGRRGGKTTTAARLLLESAEENPQIGEDESITVYIAPTKNQAKRLMWGRLQTVAKAFKVPMEFNATDLIARHKNGAQIWIMGADDDRDIDRLRGFAYRRVVVDEAQAIGADFEDLVDDVLEPALADYDGDLVLMGTPNAACIGYFYEATTGQMLDDEENDQWDTWTWTVLDNPKFPLWRGKDGWHEWAQNWLEQKRSKKGWSEDHPTFQREWLARWVRDEGGLVVRYRPDRDHYDEIPTGYHWQHVLGIDLGRGTKPKSVKGVPKGNFALNVWAFCQDLPDIYSAHQFKKSGLELDEWANIIKDVQAQYKPVASVADTGALGGVIVTDLSRRLGIHIKAAEKSDKVAAIDLLNADLANRWVHVPKDSPLAKEWNILQWDETRTREDPRFPNDLSDAALYGYREARHWAWRPREEKPEAGTKEYYNMIAKEMRQQRLRKMRKRNKHEWSL